MRSLADDQWVYKSRLKSTCYTKYDNDAKRLKNMTPNIPLEQFKVLLKYWSIKKIQNTAATNKENRKKVTDTHTAGRTSFALISMGWYALHIFYLLIYLFYFLQEN